ncbi:MAG: oxidoreductase [Alphaproteobacteria bacterium]
MSENRHDASYPTFLSPLDVGATTLRNRAVMGSMHTVLDHLDDSIERLAAYYAERARGEVGLIVTGGYAPNKDAYLGPGSPIMASPEDAETARPITEAVHQAGGKILLQVLHPGRYAKIEGAVGASEIRAPINPVTPRRLTSDEVWQTVADMANCAGLAKDAGFDGVEVMGSEGYLINQFLARRTNDRDDEWGGSLENRMRLALEVVRQVREKVGDDSIVMFRLSMIDLVEDGQTGEEIVALAKLIEQAGANILNSGIGWHEARIPTIANMVPRGAWRFATARVKQAVGIPVMAANRINTPELAEEILAAGEADLISLARPMLADPAFVAKARLKNRAIAPCIGCNQACLDNIFTGRICTCMVNPRACHETDLVVTPARPAKKIAVVGAGPAGLALATQAGERGHKVVLYEAAKEIGGQLNMAKIVPGKDDFYDLLRYFGARLEEANVELRLGAKAEAKEIAGGGYDEVFLATGVTPHTPQIEGIEHPMVLSYLDVLSLGKPVGERVAIIGAGGIGFDVAEFLSAEVPAKGTQTAYFLNEWGVDTGPSLPGGLSPDGLKIAPSRRRITILQRKTTRPGKSLGLTTGWVLRTLLDQRGVEFIAGAAYTKIDDAGLHLVAGDEARVLEVDNVIVCAGQQPARALHDRLAEMGVTTTLLGGAEIAAELDAVRAIDQGTRLALAL